MAQEYNTKVVVYAKAKVAVNDSLTGEGARKSAEGLLNSLVEDHISDVEGVEYRGVEADEVKRDN